MAKVIDLKEIRRQKVIRQYAEFYHKSIKLMDQEENKEVKPAK
jgi:hypothetical protein